MHHEQLQVIREINRPNQFWNYIIKWVYYYVALNHGQLIKNYILNYILDQKSRKS